jgi:hypothetical protein
MVNDRVCPSKDEEGGRRGMNDMADAVAAAINASLGQ